MFLIAILLCPQRLRETVQLFHICMPCCKFWPVDEKQAYVDSTHLNNSDKLCRIIYGSDKIQSFINQLSFWLNRFLYLKAEMWGLPFYETFSKLYLNIYIRYLNMLLNCSQSSCHLKSGHHCNFIVLVIMQTKSHFICCLLIFKYKTWSDLCVGTFWTSPAHFNNTVIILITW